MEPLELARLDPLIDAAMSDYDAARRLKFAECLDDACSQQLIESRLRAASAIEQCIREKVSSEIREP